MAFEIISTLKNTNPLTIDYQFIKIKNQTILIFLWYYVLHITFFCTYLCIALKQTTMKKYTYPILALLFLLNVAATPKSTDADNIYQKLEAQYENFSISFSGGLEKMLDFDLNIDNEDERLKGKFSGGKLLILKEAIERDEVNKLFQKEGFQPYEFEKEEENQEESDASFWVHKSKEEIDELHCVIDGENQLILMLFYIKLSEEETE